MEAHFVHRADSGGLAVVGVMFSEGKPNATFSKIVATMPAKEGPAVKAVAAINPNGLLPAKLGYYRYPGSLTTPPCSEVGRMAGADRSDPGRGRPMSRVSQNSIR